MRIHFIAIGGAIMHSLAIELKNNGHIITGSDDIIYDPAKSNLLAHGLLPEKYGWSLKNITHELDMVILGMHAKKDNLELLEAKKKGISIYSFPEYIYRYAINKKRIVIAGSHGKTTITSMIIHVLNENKISADYLLGAKIDSLNNLVQLQNNDVMIIEGDEYFSSAIDHTPKFMHYKPDVLIVSGVSWDHINVFPTLKSYQDAFAQILNDVLSTSKKVFYCGDDSFLANFLQKNINVVPYYLPQYIIHNHQYYLKNVDKTIPLNIFGQHNLYNLEAAKHVCLELGVSSTAFYQSISTFNSAEKRLKLIKKTKNSAIYYDFAHSPSKVLATINAVKELYPNRYLVACLELYTFSSLDEKFIPNYANVFKKADEVWIYIDKKSKKASNSNSITSEFLLSVLNHKVVYCVRDKTLLISMLRKLTFNNLNLLLMSSGNFSGLDVRNLFNELNHS